MMIKVIIDIMMNMIMIITMNTTMNKMMDLDFFEVCISSALIHLLIAIVMT